MKQVTKMIRFIIISKQRTWRAHFSWSIKETTIQTLKIFLYLHKWFTIEKKAPFFSKTVWEENKLKRKWNAKFSFRESQYIFSWTTFGSTCDVDFLGNGLFILKQQIVFFFFLWMKIISLVTVKKKNLLVKSSRTLFQG